MKFNNFNYYLAKLIKLLRLPALRDSEIDSTSKICSASHIVSTKIGRYSYVGHGCTLINTEVGSFCSIADGVVIGGASHPSDWVSTSPVFTSGKNVLKKNFSNHDFSTTQHTQIGSDVWIGNNVLVKSGVNIGNGAIIGMGSVVTKSVPVYEIWAGNPARLIRKRFDDVTISQLIDSECWNLSDEDLSGQAYLFNNVNLFLKKIW